MMCFKISLLFRRHYRDAILTLPLIQELKRTYPHSSIDVVVVPRSAESLPTIQQSQQFMYMINVEKIEAFMVYGDYGIA